MKKVKASKIQYKVFRYLFPRSIRQHKRRVFLSEAMVDLYVLCGYSPNQINEIAHDIVEERSFNLFYGVVIDNFGKYCKGYQSPVKQKPDKVEISLVPVSLSFPDFFKQKLEYKVNYYREGELVFSSRQMARRFGRAVIKLLFDFIKKICWVNLQ